MQLHVRLTLSIKQKVFRPNKLTSPLPKGQFLLAVGSNLQHHVNQTSASYEVHIETLVFLS